MKYPKYTIEKLLPLTTSLLLLLSLFLGCQKVQEPEKVEKKETLMKVFVPKAELRGGVLFSGEDLIKKVRILVFDGAGLDVQKLFVADEDDFRNPFSLTAREGHRRVYVIANETPEMAAKLSTLVFERELKGLLASHYSVSVPSPFVFVGSADCELRADQEITVPVALTRIVAKITLSLKQNSPDGDEVKIKSISLSRLASESSLLPRLSEPFSLESPWTFTHTEELDLVNKAPDFVPYVSDNTLYVYENLGSAADTLNRAPMLKIEALYNGIATTYTAYVNDESSDADHHYSIHRNHHYKIEGVITKLGDFSSLLLRTSILPWSLEELEHHFLEPKASKIVPQTVLQPEPHKNYASKETPFEVTIRVTATVGSKWRATLSNGLEFGFTSDSAVEGNADGETDYTIKVQPLKDPGNKPRKTDLYLTIDGKEVVLKKENGVRTTRISIVQKPNV